MIFTRSEWQQVPYKHRSRTLLHRSSQGKGRINLYLQTLFLLFLPLPSALLKQHFSSKPFDPQHTVTPFPAYSVQNI